MARLRFSTKLKLIAVGTLLLAAGAARIYWLHNIEWSARVAWGEARGEGEDGMQAVLNVMVNRKKAPGFPKSLSGVARQPCQFSAYNDGDPNREKLKAVGEDDPQYQEALRLATWAQVGLLPDITGGATYFHSNQTPRPAYLSDAAVSVVIGNHIFYTGADASR